MVKFAQCLIRCTACGLIARAHLVVDAFGVYDPLICDQCQSARQALNRHNKVEFFQEELTHIARHGVKW